MKVTKDNLPCGRTCPVYCVENAPVEGADGVGQYGENGKAEWYFRFSYGNYGAMVYAWVFLAECDDIVELIIDERDYLDECVAQFYAELAKSLFSQAKFVRSELPDAIRAYRERIAEAA